MLFADGDDDDFMPLDDGGSSDSDSADAAAPGTASYYKARLHEPVHPSTDVTLWQCLYALLSEKRSGQIRDKPFENHLWYLHNCLLPRYACDPRFLPHQKKKSGSSLIHARMMCINALRCQHPATQGEHLTVVIVHG